MLSQKQRRILEFLRRFLDGKGYPPTIRDIVKGCELSSTSVADYNLKILERDGYIHRDHEVSRGIDLLKGPRFRLLQVPIIGHIAAGEPIPIPTSDTWEATSLETLEIAEELARGKDRIYALRVKGTSMVDALIGDGDIILMQQTAVAENGDLVAAWLKSEKEATLKRFYQETWRIRLQPANAEMQPIYADPENVEVQGKVIAVIRKVS